MATAKTETTVTSVTLTLSIAEAEAVLALTGIVGGGIEANNWNEGPERAASNAVHSALEDALNKSSSETGFYRALEAGNRSVYLETPMATWERELLAENAPF